MSFFKLFSKKKVEEVPKPEQPLPIVGKRYKLKGDKRNPYDLDVAIALVREVNDGFVLYSLNPHLGFDNLFQRQSMDVKTFMTIYEPIDE